MKHLKYQKCNNKNTRVLKVKNSPLKLEKCYKPIIISMSNMDKFEKKKELRKDICKKHVI